MRRRCLISVSEAFGGAESGGVEASANRAGAVLRRESAGRGDKRDGRGLRYPEQEFEQEEDQHTDDEDEEGDVGPTQDVTAAGPASDAIAQGSATVGALCH
jgi:hypothetical protein